ncbi:PH domain leucine-rich repeat-containing protein phosphatase 1 [Liparis tanakae]|uniref:PH domain leucine-rich repeat-containing protein phosphatase 1 n=1 Tax=Liparis tanakae TaxID=230148 RepID=A0A4Z2EYH7_9TELE|nr:PH domain leucine-rich repeat-containing protein phosphatase 1 [Liparis tanakae]
MESGQAVAEDGASDGGATKLMKKPSGLSVARGTPADDGGGRSAPSRVEAKKNGNSLPRSASASNRAVASNGRGSSSNSSSLLLRRRRLKRNLSAAAAATAAASSAVTAACGAKMNSAPSSASLHTRSLDRKTLLKHRQNMQLQPADREWVRADLHRGSVHVHERLTPSYPRPVLCTMDTTAGEVALRLSKLGSKSSSVVRIFCKDNPKTDQNGNCNVKYEYNDNPRKVNEDSSVKRDHHQHHHLAPLESAELRGHPSDRLMLLLAEDADERREQQDAEGKLFTPESESRDNIARSLSDLNSNSNMDTPDGDDSEHRHCSDSYGLNSGSDVESSAFDDLSSGGARLSEHRDSLSDDMVLGTEASILSPSFDSATEGHDTYGSSSDELDLDGGGMEPVAVTAANYKRRGVGHLSNVTTGGRPEGRPGSLPASSSAGSLSTACSTGNAPDGHEDPDCGGGGRGPDSSPMLYVQMHGEAVRRLSPEERPLQIQNDFLFKLGFKDPWRVQEEGLNTEIGSLLRFYAGE